MGLVGSGTCQALTVLIIVCAKELDVQGAHIYVVDCFST